MKLSIKVKPGAKQTKVTKLSDKELVISVKARPEKGKANAALIKALAEYFSVSQAAVIIKKGAGSRQKLVEITSL